MIRRQCSRLCALLLLAANVGDVFAEPVDEIWLDGFEAGCGNLLYSEGFGLADNSAWPAPWVASGNVALSDIQQMRARLRPNPTGYSLARMHAPIDNRNVEVRFSLRMEDLTTQGVGFYVRQNGGYLTQTVPNGQGYAAFVEGTFRGQPGVSVWKEQAGNEIQLQHAAAPVPPLTAGTDYRARLQVLQLDPLTTRVRAKLWLASGSEPAAWQASVDDTTSVLQNLSGGIAVDSWSVLLNPTPITAHTFVDNVELVSLCAP